MSNAGHLVIAGPGWVRAHDIDDGKVRWEIFLDGDRDSWPTIATSGGRVFVASAAKLYCIDERSGQGLWKLSLAELSTLVGIRSRPTLIARGDRVFVTRSGYVECFDLRGIRQWWRENPTAGVVSMSFDGQTAQGDVNTG